MKIQVVLEDGESNVTPFRFAEAVTEFFLRNKDELLDRKSVV